MPSHRRSSGAAYVAGVAVLPPALFSFIDDLGLSIYSFEVLMKTLACIFSCKAPEIC